MGMLLGFNDFKSQICWKRRNEIDSEFRGVP